MYAREKTKSNTGSLLDGLFLFFSGYLGSQIKIWAYVKELKFEDKVCNL